MGLLASTDTGIGFIYDKFSPAVFGFIVNNTSSKEEAEKYLINVFLIVNDRIQNTSNYNEIRLIEILRIASAMIFKPNNKIQITKDKFQITNLK